MAVRRGNILPNTINFTSLGESHDIGYGLEGDDKIFGGSGNDKLFGQDGNDLLKGANGNDLLQGGDHSDKLFGDDGNDVLLGQKGNDELYGGAGNDRLEGGSSVYYLDTLDGGLGADTLIGGRGFDKMTGGAGADRFIFNIGDSISYDVAARRMDFITDFTASDTIVLNGIDRSDVEVSGKGVGRYLVDYRTGPGADDFETIKVEGIDPTGHIVFA